MRTKYYSRLVDEGKGKIIVSEPFLSFKIVKSKGSKIILEDDLIINRHLLGTTKTIIILKNDSIFHVGGKFSLGNGVTIFLEKKSSLFIGGQKIESAAGITKNTTIMVNKKITIGTDFLCAWDVFISDSDWHSINGKPHQKDVVIGDHVWVANNANILKGTVIGNGCIISSNSKLSNKTYEQRVLIAGLEGKVIKSDMQWCRDI
ncbi:MAG: hypothetical protein ABJB11_01830 [Ferruginibacter sp.]